jgi:hypothetical protein
LALPAARGALHHVDMTSAQASDDLMTISLTTGQLSELRLTLVAVLGDLSAEIADTDNAAYRRILRDRQLRLREIVDALATG